MTKKIFVNETPTIGTEIVVVTAIKPEMGEEIEIVKGNKVCAVGQVVEIPNDYKYTVLVVV
jgi:hypothetical protein